MNKESRGRATVRRIFGALVVLAVTTGLGLGLATESSARSTTHSAGDVHATSSRRITITNMTADTMTLTTIFGDKRFEGAPDIGDTIPPGASQAFEMTYLYGKTNVSAALYRMTQPDGQIDGGAGVDMKVASKGLWTPTVSSTCNIDGSVYQIQCSAGGDQVVMAGKPGSVFNLDGSAPNQTATKVLQQLCNSNIGAKCSFNARTETMAFGKPTMVGTPVANATSSKQSRSVAGSDTAQSSDSLGGSVTLTVPIGPVQTAIQATYDHTWTKSYTFTETQNLNVSARSWGWIEARVPYFQHIGTFTATYGNTTWNITNVTISSPDPKGSAIWVLRERPMTQQEYDDLTDHDWDGTPTKESTVSVLPGN